MEFGRLSTSVQAALCILNMGYLMYVLNTYSWAFFAIARALAWGPWGSVCNLVSLFRSTQCGFDGRQKKNCQKCHDGWQLAMKDV